MFGSGDLCSYVAQSRRNNLVRRLRAAKQIVHSYNLGQLFEEVISALEHPDAL